MDYLNGRDYFSEVIIVSDGSCDHTRAVVAHDFTSSERVAIKMHEYHPNRGKGYAVRYGVLKSRGERVLFMDADYATPVSEVEKGLALLDKGYDIAIGSRGLATSQIIHHQRFSRALAARVYTFVQNTYLGLPYKDTQCGFKLFKQPAAIHLFTQQKLDSVIFDPEILWLANQYGYRTAEFPVQWKHDENSRIQYNSLNKFLFVFKELFSIKGSHKKTTSQLK